MKCSHEMAHSQFTDARAYNRSSDPNAAIRHATLAGVVEQHSGHSVVRLPLSSRGLMKSCGEDECCMGVGLQCWRKGSRDVEARRMKTLDSNHSGGLLTKAQLNVALTEVAFENPVRSTHSMGLSQILRSDPPCAHREGGGEGGRKLRSRVQRGACFFFMKLPKNSF